MRDVKKNKGGRKLKYTDEEVKTAALAGLTVVQFCRRYDVDPDGVRKRAREIGVRFKRSAHGENRAWLEERRSRSRRAKESYHTPVPSPEQKSRAFVKQVRPEEIKSLSLKSQMMIFAAAENRKLRDNLRGAIR